jgi:hypothetical protein
VDWAAVAAARLASGDADSVPEFGRATANTPSVTSTTTAATDPAAAQRRLR